ncbi:uncharacterized protein TNCV_1623381 [Trichonephila clavipes]|nr:uncharacterized protein TNCV_1623381 [Trichonephila clavipes]
MEIFFQAKQQGQEQTEEPLTVYIVKALRPSSDVVWVRWFVVALVDLPGAGFQQDGAICHTARATIDLLKDTFGDRLISRFGSVNWPPRSCDLTPLDYFLWGYAKSLVYADKPQTLNHLEDNICRVTADIRPQMLKKSLEIDVQIDYIRFQTVAVYAKIIFKILELFFMNSVASTLNRVTGEDVGIFISRVKTAATRLQEAGHKLDDLYIGFQLIRWLPRIPVYRATNLQMERRGTSRVVKIEAELILEANRLQLMKQDLESGECLLERFHFEEVEDITWCCSSWRSEWQE